jgi:DNA-binding NarL/FixJ family response regulator
VEVDAGQSDASLLRIVIADDAWHYAAALEAALALERDLDVVHVAFPSTKAPSVAADFRPDVLLLGIDASTADGIAVCREVATGMPDLPVVVVTAPIDEFGAQALLAAGACGCVIKHDHTDPERILSAVRSAARGDLSFDRTWNQLLRRLATHAPDPATAVGLTPREREVLPFVADGLLNKQIAAALDLSEQTVRNHLSSIYRKLNTNNRTQTIAAARRLGILS